MGVAVGPALFCVALCLRRAVAWSPEGHERINRIAQGLLHGKHRDQIRSMMHSDVIDVYSWEKNMTTRYPDTKAFHWHRQEPEWQCDSKGGMGDRGHVVCMGKDSSELFCALTYFFEHFAHDALLRRFPKPKEPLGTPTSMTALNSVPASEQTTSNFLRWLAVLVGDLHQPLHWLSQYGFGEEIKVLFRGEQYTLLNFWEEYLPQHLRALNKPEDIDKDYGRLSPSWAHTSPLELFRQWARELAEKLCTEVYAPMTINHKDGTRIDNPFNLTDPLFEKWVALSEELMALGGERLAFILNEIIEHKRHKDAHKQGRGLPSRKIVVGTEKAVASTTPFHKDMTEEERRKHKAVAQFYKKLAFSHHRHTGYEGLWNLAIAVPLVPALLYVFELHARNPGMLTRLITHQKL